MSMQMLSKNTPRRKSYEEDNQLEDNIFDEETWNELNDPEGEFYHYNPFIDYEQYDY